MDQAVETEGTYAFIVGQDQAGRWVVLEEHGRGGGMFASRDAALLYARSESAYRPGAVRLSLRRLAFR